MKQRTLIALLGIASASLTGCYYDVEEELYPMACDSTASTYGGTVLRILETNCYACHSSGAAMGGIVLEGYDNARAYANNGKLVGTINHDAGFSPMPKNAGPLTSCDVAAIKSWIAEGAMNN